MRENGMFTPEQLAQWQSRLVHLRGTLAAQSAHLDGRLNQEQGQSLGEISTYDNHPADIGSETFERSKDLALRGMMRSRLDQVDAALARLMSGLYGICTVCGQAIPAERLSAIPETHRCIDCAQANEKQAAAQRPDAAGRHRPVEEDALQHSYQRLYGAAEPVEEVVDDQGEALQDAPARAKKASSRRWPPDDGRTSR
ncbi:MAG: TraR/DksA C4-type zinc finger protein [Thermaerobacterales bacterium]